MRSFREEKTGSDVSKPSYKWLATYEHRLGF